MNARNMIALLMLLAIPMMAVADDSIWTENFAEAKASAAKENKDLLLDFTGSDWCGWCIRLDKEVFDQPEYVEAAPEMFVHVKLDFPRNKSKITPEVKAQNERLRKAYPIRGFPTIFLTDATGKPYAQAGYGRGGPKPYLAMLKKLQAKRIQRDAALAAAAKLQGLEKAEKLGEALDAVPSKTVPLFYEDVVQQIRTLDPKSQTKAAKKWLTYAKRMAEEKRLSQLIRQAYKRGANPDEALAKIDAELKTGFDDQKMTNEVLLVKARLLASNKRGKEALPVTIDLLKRKDTLTPKQRENMLQVHAWALCQTGKKEEGIALLDEAIANSKKDNEKIMARLSKARIMTDIGETALAIDAYEQIIQATDKDRIKNYCTKAIENLKKNKE